MTKLKSLPNFPQKIVAPKPHNCCGVYCEACDKKTRNLILSEVGELECPSVPSKDEVDNFFDEYRPIIHLTKDEFNIWYCNLQKDFHNLITKRSN